MSFAIAMSFPAGRFHATPWGRHVNEGLPEWPPSPWRLLRALVAVWKRTLADDKLVNERMPQILKKLAAPPVFKLPPASLGHSRHYMPWFKGWKPGRDDESRTLVFDSFVVLAPDSEVIAAWPDVTLDSDDEKAVRLVLSHLHYFGRAESWCSARVCGGEWKALPGRACSRLDTDTGEVFGDTCSGPTELVRVLGVDPGTAFNNEHTPKIERTVGRGRQKKTTSHPLYDPDWHLCMETLELHIRRWSDPPGSLWLTYLRPSDAFAVRPHRLPSSRAQRPSPTVARFVLDGTVLPLLTETLYVAEITRRYVQGIFGKKNGGASSPLFSGKSAGGQPLTEHQHAFFLPTDEDGDGRIDHLTLVATGGFGEKELRALDAFRSLHGPGGTELGVLLSGIGTLNDFASVALLSEATSWRSVTPFLPTRHYKRRGAKRDTCSPEQFPEVILREELSRRGLPEPVSVTRTPRCILWKHAQMQPSASGRSLRWIEFRRERVFGHGRRGTHPGAGFEIVFSKPVRGPIALGYGCHFGLGLFAPASKESH